MFLILLILSIIARVRDWFKIKLSESKRPLVAGVRMERIQIPSRDPNRFIPAIKYTPEGTQGKLPVYLSWQASGFVLKRLGLDRNMHSQFAKQLNTVVIDAAYRKAPEHKFPAAFDDAEDAVAWVLASSDKFDTSKFVVGGSSAGGCLALTMSARYSPKIKGCFALYPLTVMLRQPREAPNGYFKSGIILTPRIINFLLKTFMASDAQFDDIRLNPVKESMAKFPENILVACGDADTLYNDSKLFYKKVQAEGSPAQRTNIEFLTVPNEAHEFNNFPDTPETDNARVQLYSAAIQKIRAAQNA
ncbi:hypothetical protein MVES1_002113 [Malassezia vespertilionis]|uniref:Alpha/beta hydrolase fold-3 domain-containing protein n=1 Tax=Malassezia vespertilionis TaxID=2020962 RepID=A0A2N1JBH6_9BASI|nr:uncharacterized protein MVES1_002113 [Malassezia vespertilionis]PKI83911.1 hypothetical protein MVES_001994 [Malassezia vespertilionis]WFD06759.1 hypothetical protein MVES1_002113 [Malassezia vespertilionis]